MITPLQAVAYATNVLLIVCAWQSPRLRTYAASHLALDAVRLGLSFVPCGPRPFVGVDFALLLLDGALLLLDAVILAAALRLLWLPVACFAATMLLYVAHAYPRLQGDDLERFYVVAMLVMHFYAAGGSVTSKRWRANADADVALLLGLAATGLVGAIVALAWPGHWHLVQAGNVLAFIVTSIVALMLRETRRE